MKINKITSEKVIAFKPKVNNPQKAEKTSFAQKINNNHSPNNPKYYQAINNISFQANSHYMAVPISNKNNEVIALKIRIPFEESDNATFTLTHEAQLFLDKDGKFENEKLAVFVELFEEFYKQRKSQYEKEKSILNRILSKKEENVTSINIIDDIQNALDKADAQDDEDFLEYLLMSIKDEKQRKYLTKKYLDVIEEEEVQGTVLAAKEAICILKLSKKDDGFDLSQMDKKIDIAVQLEQINKRNKTNITDDFIEAITFDGHIDFEVAKHVLKFAQIETKENLTKKSLKEYAQTIKRITQNPNPFKND